MKGTEIAELNSATLARELEDRRENVRRLSAKHWYEAECASTHPFFDRFKVAAPEGLRLYRGALVLDGEACEGRLLVPMTNPERHLQNLAFVAEDGQRKYLATDCVEGTYWSIGKASGDSTIVVTSGFLKGLQIHRELGHSVAVSFTHANSAAIATLMRERYPVAQIFVIGPGGKLEPFDAVQSDKTTIPARPIVPLRPLVAAQDSAAEKGADESTEDFGDAKKMLAWISRRRLQAFERKFMLQQGPSVIRPLARARAALDLLARCGWVEPHTEADTLYRLTPSALSELHLGVSSPAEPVSVPSTSAAGAEAQSLQQETAS
jgi:hypothetical protein